MPTQRILYLHDGGKVRRRPPLPWKTRLRLAVTRRIDITCGWLVEHRLSGVAILVWRVCGMWS